MAFLPKKSLIFSLLLLAGQLGCVQRTLTVATDPPGALVYMNDQEIGRSPVTRNFLWYGYYDVEIRKAGYQSIKTTAPVIAPWWQWVPFDFFAEFFPLTDHHDLAFTLQPPTAEQQDPKLLVRRGEELRSELKFGRKPTTQPKPKGHKGAQTRPAVSK